MDKKQKRKTSGLAGSAKGLPVYARAEDADFNPDYSYVVKDLKKIGLLAVSFIAFLVILSFIL